MVLNSDPVCFLTRQCHTVQRCRPHPPFSTESIQWIFNANWKHLYACDRERECFSLSLILPAQYTLFIEQNETTRGARAAVEIRGKNRMSDYYTTMRITTRWIDVIGICVPFLMFVVGGGGGAIVDIQFIMENARVVSVWRQFVWK